MTTMSGSPAVAGSALPFTVQSEAVPLVPCRR